MNALALATPDDAVVAAWIRKARERSPRTATEYSATVRPWRVWLAERGLTIAAVDYEALEAYKRELQLRYMPRSVSCKLGAIRGLLTFAHNSFPEAYPRNAGVLLTVPDAEMLPAAVWVKRIAYAWPVVDNEPDPRRKLAMLTILLTGIRLAEAAGLLWRDFVELEPGRWALYVKQKGGGVEPKHLAPQHAADLLAYRGDYADPAARIFGVNKAMLARWVQHAAERIGADGFSTHVLRHACVSMLKEAGLTDDEIRELIGWSSNAMLKRYNHYASGKSAGTILLAKRESTSP